MEEAMKGGMEEAGRVDILRAMEEEAERAEGVDVAGLQ